MVIDRLRRACVVEVGGAPVVVGIAVAKLEELTVKDGTLVVLVPNGAVPGAKDGCGGSMGIMRLLQSEQTEHVAQEHLMNHGWRLGVQYSRHSRGCAAVVVLLVVSAVVAVELVAVEVVVAVVQIATSSAELVKRDEGTGHRTSVWPPTLAIRVRTPMGPRTLQSGNHPITIP